MNLIPTKLLKVFKQTVMWLFLKEVEISFISRHELNKSFHW